MAAIPTGGEGRGGETDRQTDRHRNRGKERKKITKVRDVENLEPLCSHEGKQDGSFSKKLKTAFLREPEIPLLGVSPKGSKARAQRDICTPVFAATLFTTAKRQERAKGPLTGERGRQDVVYSHNGVFVIRLQKGRAICHMRQGPGGHYAK